MAQNNGSAVFLNEPLGVMVESVDYNNQQEAIVQAIGSGIVATQGTLYARSLFQPLTLATNGTMTVSIGGSSQRVLCDGYWCDGCELQSFTVPAAPASGTRLDAICIQAAPLGTNVGTVTRNAKNNQQEVSTVTVNQVVNGVSYQYVQGDTSGNPPAAPPGFTRFIVISVPANATAIANSNWSFDAAFPEMTPQGPTGPNPLSSTNAPVTIPAVGSTCGVPAVSGAAYVNGAYVTVSDGTHAFYGQIVSGGTTNSLTVKVLNILLSSQGQQIASGATISFAGSPGATGPQGTQGDQGIQGNPGTNGTSPNPRGNWAVGTAYNALDVVNFNGSGYIATASSTGVEPDTDNGSHWMLFASKGATGAQGQQGLKGDPGQNGSQGVKGDPGQNGANGQNAYSTLTAPVAIPGIGGLVSISVANASPFPYGQCMVVSDGAQAFFAQVTGTNPLTVKNLKTISQGNGTVGSGGTVTPAGVPVDGAVGATYCNFERVASAETVQLQLPAVLPDGTYKLFAEYFCHIHNGSGSAQLSGSSGTWEAPSSSGTGSAQGADICVQLTGTAVGGQQPAITLSFPSPNTLDYGGVLEIWAVRVA